MKITLRDRPYHIDWEHAHFNPPVAITLDSGKQKLVKASTTCLIQPTDVVGGTIHGVAWCSVLDIFSKEKGRKVALTEALAALDLTKEERRGVWEAYRGRS